MKKIPGVGFAIIGLLMVLTPWLIFPICGQGRYAPPSGTPDKPHKCIGTAYVATGLGAAIALAGIVAAVRPRRRTVRAAAAATAALAGLAVLSPKYAGICMMATMPCRAGTVPALAFLFVLSLAAAAATGLASRGWK